MHKTPHLKRRFALCFNDPDNARALSNLLPEAMVMQIRSTLASENARLFELTERGLLTELRRRDKKPDAVMHQLRLRFWLEFERVQDEDDRAYEMNMDYVLGRTVPKEKFYRFIITDPIWLAYILCPPAKFEECIELGLTLAINKINEFLENVELYKGTEANLEIVTKVCRIAEQLQRNHNSLKYGSRSGGGRVEKKAVVARAEVLPVELSLAERLQLARVKKEKAKEDTKDE